jgi:hypothetical protein
MQTEATTGGVSRTDNVGQAFTMTSPAFGQGPPYAVRTTAAAAAVLPLLWALSSFTSAITYAGEPLNPARYVSSSALSPVRRRQRQRVSLKEAREIALEVLRQANQDLREERQTEARFILRFWDEQND